MQDIPRFTPLRCETHQRLFSVRERAGLTLHPASDTQGPDPSLQSQHSRTRYFGV